MPGGITCSVMSCKNNSTTARKMGKSLGFFTFPKDLNVRKEWVSRCNRKEDWNPSSNSSRICSDHFQISDFEDVVKAHMLNVHPKRLKSNAIPSLYLKAPKLEVSNSIENIITAEGNKVLILKSEENQLEQHMHLPENPKSEKLGSSKGFESLKITPKEKFVKQKDHDLIKMESDYHAVHTKTNSKLDTEKISNSKNVINTPNSLSEINQQCRLCLETSPPLFAFESVVTFDDGSTLDVYQTFQKITRETDEQIQNENPAYLCMSCLKLLVSANNFHERYQRSLMIRKNILGQVSEMIEDIPEKIEIAEMKLAQNSQVELGTSGACLHKCPICSDSFTALDLKKHCWEHREFKSYLHAAPKYNRKVKFYAHPRSTVSIFNIDNPSFTCPFCSEELDTNTYFEHLGEHEKLRNFKCQICDLTFPVKGRLFVHQRSHKREVYQCPKSGCSKRFLKKKSFDYHIAKHTDLDDLPFRCSACSKAFANPQDLKGHILNHENSTNEKQAYFCSNCLKTFSNQSGFRHHSCCKKEMLHSKSLVLCYVCGKRVLNMHQHMKVHAGQVKEKETTHICLYCGKVFGNITNLCKHIKCLHTSELTTNNCQNCSKKCMNSNELNTHECTNSAVRFLCDVCQKQFTERGYLTRHQKKAHPELFYEDEMYMNS